MKTFLTALIAMIGSSVALAVDVPCKDKRTTKFANHKTLHECLMNWTREGNPFDPDPKDDCSTLLASFVQSEKDLKECRKLKKPEPTKSESR